MFETNVLIPIEEVEIGDTDGWGNMIVVAPRQIQGRWHYWIATTNGPMKWFSPEIVFVRRSLWERICHRLGL